MPHILSYVVLIVLARSSCQELKGADEYCPPDLYHVLIGRILSLELRDAARHNEYLQPEKQSIELNSTIVSIQKENSMLKELNEKLTNRVQNYSRHGDFNFMSGSSLQTFPAFRVRSSTKTQYFQNEIVMFETVALNVHHSFNQTTGKFTATVQGRYWFSASIRAQQGKYCHPGIYKNGFAEAYILSGADATDWSSSGSASIVLDLNVTDEVYVGETHTDGLYQIGIFSGTLLYPF